MQWYVLFKDFLICTRNTTKNPRCFDDGKECRNILFGHSDITRFQLAHRIELSTLVFYSLDPDNENLNSFRLGENKLDLEIYAEESLFSCPLYWL